MIRKLEVKGRILEYEITRKKVKNINMRIGAESVIKVSASNRATIEMIEKALIKNADYIFKAQEKIKRAKEKEPAPLSYKDGEIIRIFGNDYQLKILYGNNKVISDNGCVVIYTKEPENKELLEKLCNKYLRTLVVENINNWCREIFPRFKKYNIAYPEMGFRKMKARWGSCHSNKGKVFFNTELVHKSEAFCRYVIVHELSHFVHPDHSAAFYRLVEEIMPDYKLKSAEQISK
ncbi:MAG: M48 family metallopeptidase [Ruminiclostridium sp.]|nr:M48 family metallopeptidase [Ruminiclostridium sp.]